MALYIPHSIFHLARLLYVRPETFWTLLRTLTPKSEGRNTFLHIQDHIFRHRSLLVGTLAANWNEPGPLSGSSPAPPLSAALSASKHTFCFPILDQIISSNLNRCSSLTPGTHWCMKAARHNTYSTLCPLGPLQSKT
jgi:hypothetical protein